MPASSASIDGRHVSVLLEEAVEGLAVRAGGWYLDATFGAGGHSAALVARGARVVAFDLDPVIEVPAELARAVTLVRSSFADLEAGLEGLGIEALDGALFDLGISSMQLDDPARGFSFQGDGPLDMRMNPALGQSAHDLLATLDEREIADLIYAYGEERASRRIARAVVAAREAGTLPACTVGFAQLVSRAVRARGYQRTHPATRTFQALRIAVNDELHALERGLESVADRIRPGGRVAVISFHSLEDRIVKQAFRNDPRWQALVKKPIVAGAAERARNPRARSAKLRLAERAG